MSQRIEARRTEVTFPQMAETMLRVWEPIFGTKPRIESLCVLLAQSALETGQWKACYCYNLGNVKAGKSWTGDYCFYYADEIVDPAAAQKWLDLRAPRTDGKPGDNITLKQLASGKVQTTLYPDHPACRFRAFKTLDEAVRHHFEFLQGRYVKALPFAEAGDPAGFVRSLRENGYFTASLEPYIRSVSSLFEKFKLQLAQLAELVDKFKLQVARPESQDSSEFTETLRDEYRGLYKDTEINGSLRSSIEGVAETIKKNRPRYDRISAATSVPWHVIGVLHFIECNLDFDRGLNESDIRLTGLKRIWENTPQESRPTAFEWSAAEALQLLGFAGWGDYSLEGTLYRLEMHGGFELRWYHPEIKSPFLWSGTNHYTKGRFFGGKFDANEVVKQIGAAAILFALEEKGFVELQPPMISFGGAEEPPPKYPGRVIQRGERDRAIVRQIQERLAANKANAGLTPDGIFGEDTESAIKEFQSQNEDSQGRNLTADGKIGALTWEALFGNATVVTSEPSDIADSLLAKALLIADSQIGVVEQGGDNRGKMVETYQQSVGVPPGSAWCAAFVYWCFERAAIELGERNPLVRTAGCLMHWVTAQKQGIRVITQDQARHDPSLVQPGHIFIMNHGSGKGHTGIVRRVEGGTFYTIEGNTNKAGSREGNCVFDKTRTIEEINAGFIDYGRPHKQIAAPVEITAPRAVETRKLTDICAYEPTKSAGGILRAAVEAENVEEPTWVEVPFQGYRVFVGADALRAQVGGKLRRLPVSYQDVVAICTTLNWVPPSSALSDAIYRAAAVRAEPKSQPASSRMVTLEYVIVHDDAVEKQIPAEKRGKLVSTAGKDWILSPRNILHARGSSAPAATTYGWHQKTGVPIQGLGNDDAPPFHDDNHFDYSQTMRPIKRWAIRVSDGTPVDLLKVLCQKMPAGVMAPFPPDARDDEPRTTHDDDDVAPGTPAA